MFRRCWARTGMASPPLSSLRTAKASWLGLQQPGRLDRKQNIVQMPQLCAALAV